MIIAGDFETYNICEEYPIPPPVCFSYWDGTKGDVLHDKDMYNKLKEILESEDDFIAHNMNFELNVIYQHFPDLRDSLVNKLNKGQIYCTKIYEQHINYCERIKKKKFPLDLLVKKYFRKDISESKKDPDSWRLRYRELEGIHPKDYPKEAYDYSLQDSIWAYKVFVKQIESFKTDTLLDVKTDFWLNKMGLMGVPVNPKSVDILDKAVRDIVEPLKKELAKEGIYRIEKGVYKRNDAEFRELVGNNIPNAPKTKSGKASIAKEDVERYLGWNTSIHELLLKYKTIQEYDKILTSYTNKMKNQTLIRSTYSPGCITGRTSSASSKFFPSWNAQQAPREVKNVPVDVRGCIEAPPGYFFWSIDYSSMEPMMVANQLYEITGRRETLDLYNQGDKPIDPHSQYASLVYSKVEEPISYEEFLKVKKLAPWKKYRQVCKAIVNGLGGGMGMDTMRHTLELEGIYLKLVTLDKGTTENELKYLRNEFRKRGEPVRIKRVGKFEFLLVWDELMLIKEIIMEQSPDFKAFLEWGHKDYILPGSGEWIKNEFGEEDWEPHYLYKVQEHSAWYVNYTKAVNGLLMQPLGALCFKSAVCALAEKYRDSIECIPAAGIHDEICGFVLDTPKKFDIMRDVSYIMLKEAQKRAPHVRLACEAEICGKAWCKEGGEWSKQFWLNPGEDKLLC